MIIDDSTLEAIKAEMKENRAEAKSLNKRYADLDTQFNVLTGMLQNEEDDDI